MSGKRANIFGQGRPESPYDERDEASDVPQRATAAQLAARKIKSAKPRRPAGSSSVSSQGAGFGAPPGSNFGASAPAPSNGMSFGGNNAFGGGANNSFPPSQSSAPSNSFVSSSFPAFGASTPGTGFNPQPPSAAGFNFTAGNSNPFASTNGATPMSSAPSTNGFGGGGIFSSQAPSNPFSGLSQGSTTSASTSGGLFGTVSNPPSSNMFGTTNATSNASGASTPAPAPFTFGAPASTSQNTAGTPATSAIFSGFGASSQTAQAPVPNNIFSGFGAAAAKSDATSEGAKPGLFSSISSGQNSSSAAATAPSTGLFNFGAIVQKPEGTSSPAPPTNMFGTSNAATPSSNATSNPFGNPPKPASTPAPAFSFGQQQAAATPDKAASNPFSSLQLPESAAETPKPSLFSSIKTPQQATPAPAETPKANPFASLAKPPPAASTPAFSFGGSQSKEKDAAAPVKELEAAKPNVFSGFSTPQPTKPAAAEKPAGLFSAQPKTSSGMFPSGPGSEKPSSSNTFTPQSSFAPAQPQTAQNGAKESSTSGANNPFAKLPAAPPTSMFAPKESVSASTSSPTPMPTLTSGASTSTPSASGPDLPQVPKAHVPKGWIAGSAAASRENDVVVSSITGLIAKLQTLNLRYREKINSISPTADWSSLSQWHFTQSSALKKQIDNAKKQHASSKGITGHESSLSMKRKVNEELQEDRGASPSKRARPAEAAPAPAVQPSTPTPKSNPPAPTATSNIFAKAINSQPAAPANSLFSSKPAEAEPSKTSTATAGFKPSAPAANGTSSSGSLFSGGFKPTTSSAISGSNSGGFKPAAASGSGGGFASQFASKAKTYEELAAERKKKAKDEDYDSEDETEAEWSARYDKEETERLAKEKADVASCSGFSLPASAKTSGASTPAANPFASLAKPATGASTSANGLFSNSRLASPALSTGSQSIFAASITAQPASPNIFGNISSGDSSNHQEDSDEDDEEPVGSVEATTPPKRKFGESDAETDEDDTVRQAKQNKGSLLSRMTRAVDSGSESEKENKASSLFSQSNGTSTPTNKPFNFFDFSAAGSKTAPPKSSDTTFGGDQTFKPGTPIKFGEAPTTEQKAAPTFSFQPASTSTTPSKPPPSSFFNLGSASGGSSLLTPAGGLSGLNSAPSSVFSSRAATPLSEADTSAQSAAEDEEEGGKQEQIDLGKLTEEELASNDVVFETDLALAKHHVDKGDGEKVWENFARGPLWILKDKKTGKCFVRIRIASGATPLNYNILPALKSSIIGSSAKMIQASMPKTGGGIAQVFISVKTADIAKEFSTKYNESLP